MYHVKNFTSFKASSLILPLDKANALFIKVCMAAI